MQTLRAWIMGHPRPLPSLNYLRSFQIIGKHLNLVRAADEMHVTASALSHQLQILESEFGVKLFVRTGRGLSFTSAGSSLHAAVDVCLNQLSAAVRDVMRETPHSALVVNAMPTFATRWLLPRFASFASFEKRHSDVEIRVSTLPIDFQCDNVDCAIYYGRTPPSNVESELLREEDLIVVCAPSILAADKPLALPPDLMQYPLLHAKPRGADKARVPAWEAWLEAVGAPGVSTKGGLVLETRNLLIEAAKSGLGMAVIDPLLIQPELESGKLVQPLPQVARSGCSYYLAYPSPELLDSVCDFRAWLKEQLRRDAAPSPSATAAAKGKETRAY